MDKVNVHLSDGPQEALTQREHPDSSGHGRFTPQLTAIVDGQRAERARQGRDVTARDLLCGILKHGDNPGARAVAAMGVALPAPRPAGTPPGAGTLAPDALDALADAYTVSRQMRHTHTGTEHVVIALATPGSPVHDLFDALGITDRLLTQHMLANPHTTHQLRPGCRKDRAPFVASTRHPRRLPGALGRNSEQP